MANSLDETPREPRKQMNVRLPESLIAAVDGRRDDVGLSRDVWVERALLFALSQPRRPQAPGHQLRGSTIANTVAGRTMNATRPRRSPK